MQKVWEKVWDWKKNMRKSMSFNEQKVWEKWKKVRDLRKSMRKSMRLEKKYETKYEVLIFFRIAGKN